MAFLRPIILALALAVASATESLVVGKWSCTNFSDPGSQSPWTLLVRDVGKALAGTLTNGEVEIALSEMKLEKDTLTFRLYVNAKPYSFEGRVNGSKLEGKYKGEEASGTLRCEKAGN